MILAGGAAQAESVGGAPAVSAVDPNGDAINIPYYMQGACSDTVATLSGSVEAEEFAPSQPPKFEAADCGNWPVETTLISQGRTCTNEDYPYWTISPPDAPGCFARSLDSGTSISPAIWIVRAPLTATDNASGPDNGDPLIFDYWENDGATTDRCRTGDTGEVTSWPGPQGEDFNDGGSGYPVSFTDGDVFRAWGGLNTADNGAIVAHYALASDAGSVAPLVELDAPIDCQSYPLERAGAGQVRVRRPGRPRRFELPREHFRRHRDNRVRRVPRHLDARVAHLHGRRYRCQQQHPYPVGHLFRGRGASRYQHVHQS